MLTQSIGLAPSTPATVQLGTEPSSTCPVNTPSLTETITPLTLEDLAAVAGGWGNIDPI